MKDMISVIIPVYNVAEYLPQCLESVLSQDYTNLEIILIDDGSNDNSGKICDAYAERDSRIRVIHQANAGAGAAKNAGLRIATGKYLAFLDSDDYLEPEAYSHMVGLMEAYDVDVVQCALQYVFLNRIEPQIVTSGRQVYECLDYMKLYTEDWTCALMTEKLFKRSLFDGIFFEEGNIIDDEYFTYQGVMNAGKILRDEKIIYSYRQRRSSVMNSVESRKRIFCNRLDYLNKRRKRVSERYPQLRRHFYTNYLEALVFLAKRPGNTEDMVDRIKKEIRNYFHEEYHPIPGLSLLPRLGCLCYLSTSHLMKGIADDLKVPDVETLFD